MTLPRHDRLKFMVFNSSKCCCVICSPLWIFSEPAKSHKLSFPLSSIPLASGWDDSISNWKIVCDREEWMFEVVCLVILDCSPRFNNLKQSCAFCTMYSDYPSTKIPAYLSSLITSGLSFLRSCKRSNSFSL